MNVVVNASPLIFLGKAKLLVILSKLFKTVYTTKGVLDEIEKPLVLGLKAPEVDAIKKSKWVVVLKLRQEELRRAARLSNKIGVHKGEAETAILYLRGNYDMLIVADIEAERRLGSLGINTRDLSDILYLAAQKGIIDLQSAAKAVWSIGYRTNRVKQMMRI